MSSSIFISYRRADTGALAERLNRAFADYFGEERVFFDLEDIGHGERWRERIAAQVARADTVVVLIGPGWQASLDERVAAGTDDVLRFELATALASRKRVLPVLADGAAMPEPSRLPADLRALSHHQAATLAGDRFDDGLRALLLSLRMPWAVAFGWASANTFAWIVGVAAAAGLFALAASLYGTSTPDRKGVEFFSGGMAPGALLLYGAAGAVLALTIGGAQWLVLRRWWARLHWLPLSQAACGAVGFVLAAVSADAKATTWAVLAGLAALLALAVMPVLTWLAMRRRIEGAGWFNLVNLVAPGAAGIAVVSVMPMSGKEDPLGGMLLLAAMFAANLFSGALLMLLIRRSRMRAR